MASLGWSEDPFAPPGTITAAYTVDYNIAAPSIRTYFDYTDAFGAWVLSGAAVTGDLSVATSVYHTTRSAHLTSRLGISGDSDAEFVRYRVVTDGVTVEGPTVTNELTIVDPVTEPTYYPGDIISVVEL